MKRGCDLLIFKIKRSQRAAALAWVYSVTVGILRGAMKYIQVSAMKYIAGIRVNNTV